MYETLPRTVLGNTGLQVTRLGYGTMGLRGPNTWGVRVVGEPQAEEFLNWVLDSGINLIDTAPDYGICEQRIGSYISSRRNEYVLATKCGCAPIQHADHLEIRHIWDRDTLRRNVESSLLRLQTNCVDIMQCHGGDAITLQRSGVIDTLLDYREKGVIRFLGVSTSLPEVEELLGLKVFDVFQLPYSCLTPQHAAVIQRASEAGVGMIIRSGLAKGGPNAEIQRPKLNAVWERAELDELLPSGMQPAELILRYTMSNPHCHSTIVGTCNPKHLQANLQAAAAGSLPSELYDAITQRVEAVLA